MNRRFVLQALAAGVAAALVPRDEPVLTLDAIKRVRAHIMRDQIRGEWFAILPSKAGRELIEAEGFVEDALEPGVLGRFQGVTIIEYNPATRAATYEWR